jgi:hypothetical protein
MTHAAGPEVVGSLSILEKSCGYCGARFRVLATQLPDAGESRRYHCPGCCRQYEIQAATEPEVRLLRNRTDGKDDRYQETIF